MGSLLAVLDSCLGVERALVEAAGVSTVPEGQQLRLTVPAAALHLTLSLVSRTLPPHDSCNLSAAGGAEAEKQEVCMRS